MTRSKLIVLARKILPITRPGIDHGALVIDKGKIAALGREKDIIKTFKAEKVLELGKCIIMPGLVNLHTHLDLSHLYGKVRGKEGFFDWIGALVEQRNISGTKGQRPAAARAIKSMIRSGTTCIGDISSTDAVIPDIIRSRIRALIFLEVIGLDEGRAKGAICRLLERLDSFKDVSDRVRIGVSPHAPYSVSSKLFKDLSNIISSSDVAVSIHISETPDEHLHLKGKPSGFDGYMKRFGWDRLKKNKGRTPLSFIKEFGLDRNLLAVHAVHVTKGDMAILRGSRATVCHCPRSNYILGVGKAPVKEFLARGINVGLGTDSLASNDDLDLWEEMRFAHRSNGLSAETVFEMATINGARGLGLGDTVGSLEPGKYADLIAVDTASAGSKDPYLPLLTDAGSEYIAMTMVQGKPLYLYDKLKESYAALR